MYQIQRYRMNSIKIKTKKSLPLIPPISKEQSPDHWKTISKVILDKPSLKTETESNDQSLVSPLHQDDKNRNTYNIFQSHNKIFTSRSKIESMVSNFSPELKFKQLQKQSDQGYQQVDLKFSTKNKKFSCTILLTLRRNKSPSFDHEDQNYKRILKPQEAKQLRRMSFPPQNQKQQRLSQLAPQTLINQAQKQAQHIFSLKKRSEYIRDRMQKKVRTQINLQTFLKHLKIGNITEANMNEYKPILDEQGQIVSYEIPSEKIIELSQKKIGSLIKPIFRPVLDQFKFKTLTNFSGDSLFKKSPQNSLLRQDNDMNQKNTSINIETPALNSLKQLANKKSKKPCTQKLLKLNQAIFSSQNLLQNINTDKLKTPYSQKICLSFKQDDSFVVKYLNSPNKNNNKKLILKNSYSLNFSPLPKIKHIKNSQSYIKAN